jgi:hypothetical protein
MNPSHFKGLFLITLGHMQLHGARLIASSRWSQAGANNIGRGKSALTLAHARKIIRHTIKRSTAHGQSGARAEGRTGVRASAASSLSALRSSSPLPAAWGAEDGRVSRTGVSPAGRPGAPEERGA